MKKEQIAVYPGTFDPITNGHIDVIERASQIFDKVIVVIGVNLKKTTLFSETERKDMADNALTHIQNVEVATFSGLTVDFAENNGASVIIRGIRAVADFESEFQMSLMNRKLSPTITTFFLMPHEKYTYLNSSIVRELASLGRSVVHFVPEYVSEKLKEKYKLMSNSENRKK